MKHRILILGKGFIGDRLQEELSCGVSTRRISAFSDIFSQIQRYRPEILINCIGHTGAGNVDGCELALDKTLQANTYIPILLAEAAYRHKIKLVHLSSGCIFHYDYARQRPITENPIPDYYDLYYSRSKIYAENVLRGLARRCNILILRIRIPLDVRPHPKNLLTKLISYKTVIDVPNSVTYIPDFIRALRHLIKIDARGIYNVVAKGPLRYPALLDVYRNYVPGFQYKVISLKQLKLARTNLILSTRKLERTGFKVRPINEILRECVQEYVKY
jgi:dTDP-4-dehydrorhamnose reductase